LCPCWTAYSRPLQVLRAIAAGRSFGNIFGSRERRVDEFRTLGSAHGLVLDTVTDLSDQRCLLEFRTAG
jgi:hypothetical protein